MTELYNLVELRLMECERCKHFPQFGLSKLKRLDIKGMNSLEYFPRECLGSLTSLESVDIDSLPRLTSLPLGLWHLSKLVKLSIRCCRELDLSKDESGKIILDVHGLQSLRSVTFSRIPKLESLPQWILQLRSLEHLLISDCSNLKALLEQIEKCEELDISKDESSNILDFHGGLQSLRSMDITHLPKLTSLPQWLLQARNLEDLTIWECKELDLSKDESGNIILDVHGLQSLRSVTFSGIPKLESLPQWILRLCSLEHLEISICEELDLSKDESSNIILDFHGLQSLRSLKIEDLPKLESLPQWIQQHRSLEGLIIRGCPNFKALSEQIEKFEELDISKDESGNILDFHGGLQSLRFVTIYHLPKLTSLPQCLLQARNLERLIIRSCHNLKAIPEQMEALQSLQYLDISWCNSLTSFPEAMRRLTSLTHLNIFDCGELEESCKRQAGEDWDKIAHIPHISYKKPFTRGMWGPCFPDFYMNNFSNNT
ncbi:hypothetical protein ACJRO7_010364 [Eucalyptus globulus]|uniref:Disease resistance R13L4/SHOC-2-like LRR domain-containing protein n=1 Tax=Eucalyptus globulus TaxID=34317 RepID=A0ABD3LBT3_EUCGL